MVGEVIVCLRLSPSVFRLSFAEIRPFKAGIMRVDDGWASQPREQMVSFAKYITDVNSLEETHVASRYVRSRQGSVPVRTHSPVVAREVGRCTVTAFP